jgi:hypothetical protein
VREFTLLSPFPEEQVLYLVVLVDPTFANCVFDKYKMSVDGFVGIWIHPDIELAFSLGKMIH